MPRQGQAAGTVSPVLGRPPCAPRSRPVNPGAKAPARGRHHGDGKADRSTGSDRTGRGAAHHAGARRQPREARCPRTGSGQHPTQTPQTPARNRGLQAESAPQHTHPNTPARNGGAPQKPYPKHIPTPHPPARNGAVQAEHTHKHSNANTQAWVGGVKAESRNKDAYTTNPK